MATDYDAPRSRESTDATLDGGVRLDTRRSEAAAATLTVDDDLDVYASSNELLDLLTGNEQAVVVVAQGPDEFTLRTLLLDPPSQSPLRNRP